MIKNKIVVVPFPFDHFTSVKVRPALCLTSEVSEHEHVIIAFISSKIPDETVKSDIIITKSSNYFLDTGIHSDSVIRLHKIMTIPKKSIKRKLGTISINIEKQVLHRLHQLFNSNKI